MKEHKIKENAFTWVPLNKRKSRFGGLMSPRKPENRLPLLWLAREGDELYFVNSSEETLNSVIADGGDFQTVDDDVLTLTSGEKYEYKHVKPNTAVKIDEYDGYYDLDYVIQIYIRVQSKSLECVDITCPPKKGGIEETVLLWDTGENGKMVTFDKCQQA